MSTTRRSVLELGMRSAAALGAASLFKGTAFGSAGGADRAVVAIHMIGGNDSNNMFVPADGPEYDFYQRGRGELAIARASLLTVTSPRHSATYGFHPAMSEIRRLYDQGALAVMANTGPLVARVTRAEILAGQAVLPPDMSSHTGNSRWHYEPWGFSTAPWATLLQQPVSEDDPREVFGFSSGLLVIPAERSRIEGKSLDNDKLLAAMNSATPLRTQFPDTGLGLQLQQVAQLLQVGERMGLVRPVFSTSLGGFDTHRDQLPRHALLLATLSDAMGAFYEATRELGVADRVTTYTDTDFNRTLAPNQTHGTEHGWGGHHLVMGAVRGGDIIGRMPSLELGGPDDAGSLGAWIPTTASDEFHRTLALGYGLPASDLGNVLPAAKNSLSLMA